MPCCKTGSNNFKVAKHANIKTIFPELNIQTREINRHCQLSFGFIFWTTVLLGCLVLCFMQIWSLIHAYTAYDYTLVTKEIDVPSLPYPDVFICPVNSFNFTKMKAEGLDNQTIRYLMYPLDYTTVDKTEYKSNFDKSRATYNNWLLKHGMRQSLEATYLYFRKNISDYVKYCMVANSNVSCSIHPRAVIPWTTGYCSILIPSDIIDVDTGQSVVQSVPGRFGSFKIVLQKPADAFQDVGGTSNDVDFQFAIANTTSGGPSTELGGEINANLGTITIVSIKKQIVQKLSEPYGSCLDEDRGQQILANYSQAKFAVYSHEVCHMVCETKHAMQKCENNCTMPGFYITALENPYEVCETADVVDCMKRYLRKANCSNCYKPCNFIRYDKAITVGTISNPNDAALEIYHDSLAYISYVDKPAYTMAGIVSAVGGQMSLWLGFKLATILQLIYYGSLWIFQSKPQRSEVTSVAEEVSKANNNEMVYDD